MLSEIPYRADSTCYFEPWAENAWAAFLDSGRPLTGAGRYDILAADPYITLTTHGGVTEIRCADRVQLSPRDPFALLRDRLGESVPPLPGLPFRGGGHRLVRLRPRPPYRAVADTGKQCRADPRHGGGHL